MLGSSQHNFQGLINALAWSNGFRGERGKRGGMVGKGKLKAHGKEMMLEYFFNEVFLGAEAFKFFFKKLDHELKPLKKALFRGLTSWSIL